MVKTFIFLMLMTFSLTAAPVTVTSEMNYTQLFAGSPLTGTITITHDKKDIVDVNSVKLGGKPLTISFLNNVEMSSSSSLIVSLYSFEIPTLPKGLHVLPAVSVKVGDKIYKSYSSSFEVFASQGGSQNAPPDEQAAPAPHQTSDASTWAEAPELLLEAKVDGPTKLYPGQQTKFIYKYLYRGHINLTKEVIPLLDGVGLKKVGDKQTADYTENNLNVSEFSQVFEADKPGNYIYGPSIIEGLAYQENSRGEKTFSTTPLHSEASPIAIEVVPFPTDGKPASFNGAIGTYTFKASLKSAAATEGEKIVLLLEMSGDPKYMSSVKAPDLTLQPGFSGIFKPSDLPPIATMLNSNTKQFMVELKPLSTFIKEIPLIEFSSFDPATSKYIVLRAKPIPLTVTSTSSDSNSTNVDKTASKNENQDLQTDPAINKADPIEISGIDELSSSDLQNKYFGTYWNLLFLPVFVVLLLTERSIKKEWDTKKPEIKQLPSEDIFKSALAAEAGSSDFYRLLQKALITALQEQGSLTTSDIEPENLEKTGLQGDVRIFLNRLDEVRFSGNKNFNQAIISSAKELYSKIKGISS